MYRAKFVRALFPGRFQPPHKGHGYAIKWILEELSDEVIIVIGSAQESHTFQNPMTAGERVYAIKLMLKDMNIDLNRVYIIPVPDIFMNRVWPRFVEVFSPSFDVVVTRNPLVRELFEELGYKVVPQPLVNRDTYVGTKIRRLMVEGGNWEQYLTSSVASYIKEIRLVDRLKLTLGSE